MSEKLLLLQIFLMCLATIELAKKRDSYPDDTTGDFLHQCLEYHNAIREKHHATKMQIKPMLIKYAKERLKTVTQYDKLSHKHIGLNETVGENLYRAVDKKEKVSCQRAISRWYDEIKHYDFKKAKFSEITGHFTALIWANSTELGCAQSSKKVNKKQHEVYIDCIYGPPGNYIKEMKDNVKKSKEDPDKVLKEAESKYAKKNGTKEAQKEIKFFSSVLADLDEERRRRKRQAIISAR